MLICDRKPQSVSKYAEELHQQPQARLLYINAGNAAHSGQSVRDVTRQLPLYRRKRLMENFLLERRKGSRLAALDNLGEANLLFQQPVGLGEAHSEQRRIDYLHLYHDGRKPTTTRNKGEALQPMPVEDDMVTVMPISEEEGELLPVRKLRHQNANHRRLTIGPGRMPPTIPQRTAHSSASSLKKRFIGLVRLIQDPAAVLPSLTTASTLLTLRKAIARTSDGNAHSLGSSPFFEDDTFILPEFLYAPEPADSQDWETRKLIKDTIQVWLEDYGRLNRASSHLGHSAILWSKARRILRSAAHDHEDVDLNEASTRWPSISGNEKIATNITGARGTTFIPDIHIQRIAQTLFCTQELLSIRAAALNDEKIGQAKVEMKFRCLVVDFGKGLELESTTKNEFGAAKLLQTRHFSARIARQMSENKDSKNEQSTKSAPPGVKQNHPWRRSWIGASNAKLAVNALNHQAEAQDDQSETSEDHLGNERGPYGHTPDFQGVEHFLLNCKAYSAFRLKLLDFVHDPYMGRVLKALGAEATDDTGEPLSTSSLRAVGREISWAPTNVITFQSEENLSTFDQVKAVIEELMEESWNWWPCSARRRPLRDGFIRINWVTVRRHINHKY